MVGGNARGDGGCSTKQCRDAGDGAKYARCTLAGIDRQHVAGPQRASSLRPCTISIIANIRITTTNTMTEAAAMIGLT
ncbi:MAG: hypothetical protein JWP25_917 [Bradyrhizobium sp.]|jgi:hypothetical protein|nr:hypothetical protein [Bradyrhizobium sp.]